MRDGGVIISIGGGGFTHGTDPELDDFCLHFLPAMPDIGYIGWANGDDETRLARFYARFHGRARSLSHLPQGATAAAAQDWLAGKHLVYLAGGNTLALVGAMQSGGLLPVFLAANRSGCLLAGVSAGGVCWFDWILSDSLGDGYAPLGGLGAVTGGICPHYSSETARKPAFERALFGPLAGPAYAVDDGACLVSAKGAAQSCFSVRGDRSAYRLTRQGGRVVTQKMPEFAANRA
ncbi:MAG: Type 1 glutamine amidotransferase-like domain-containing protein [Paracoccaceae bacterium]